MPVPECDKCGTRWLDGTGPKGTYILKEGDKYLVLCEKCGREYISKWKPN
jgi:uncharacterized Zn finger protein